MSCCASTYHNALRQARWPSWAPTFTAAAVGTGNGLKVPIPMEGVLEVAGNGTDFELSLDAQVWIPARVGTFFPCPGTANIHIRDAGAALGTLRLLHWDPQSAMIRTIGGHGV